jgi:outer membrane protein assembly factor BamB
MMAPHPDAAMKGHRGVNAARIVPLATTVGALIALWLWLSADSTAAFTVRAPGADDRPAAIAGGGPSAPLLGKRSKGTAVPSTLPGSWPAFRGADLDNINKDSTPLNVDWGPDGPPVLWTIDVGEGHAGAAIHKGCVYVYDYDRDNQSDTMRSLSLETGEEIWRYSYPIKVKRNHGMSRTVPAVTDDYLVGIGPKCHVICLGRESGSLLWSLDLIRDYGSTEPPWYAGQCPIVDGDKAIIAPSGSDLMLAIDISTGDVLWRAPNPRAWKMTHVSVTPMVLDDVRMYIYAASGGVYGVDATDGSILFSTDMWKVKMAAVASPVVIGPGRILFSGGYGSGSLIAQIDKSPEGYTVREIARHKEKVFGADQATPVFYKGHVYGVRHNGELTCMAPDGSIVWTSGTARRFGQGYEPWLVAGDKLFVLDKHGSLTVADATPDGYKELASHKVLHGHDCWGPIALAEGRMIVRDLVKMTCLDLREK